MFTIWKSRAGEYFDPTLFFHQKQELISSPTVLWQCCTYLIIQILLKCQIVWLEHCWNGRQGQNTYSDNLSIRWAANDQCGHWNENFYACWRKSLGHSRKINKIIFFFVLFIYTQTDWRRSSTKKVVANNNHDCQHKPCQSIAVTILVVGEQKL